MIRLAWHWLERWHEPLVVGAAVTLMALAHLAPVTTEGEHAGWPRNGSLDGRSAAPAERVRRDDQFYRDQWAREAKRFYTLHPPRQLADAQTNGKILPATAVTFADARQGFTDARQGKPAIAHAYHADTGSRKAMAPSASMLTQASPGAKTSAVPARLKRWRVASCLATGMLASLAFAAIWPAVSPAARLRNAAPAKANQTGTVEPAPPSTDPPREEAIAIRLPAAWVRVRPTMSQTLRRGVLGGSYLMAALGGWAMLG